jgi:hypothetical protein
MIVPNTSMRPKENLNLKEEGFNFTSNWLHDKSVHYRSMIVPNISARSNVNPKRKRSWIQFCRKLDA